MTFMVYVKVKAAIEDHRTSNYGSLKKSWALK